MMHTVIVFSMLYGGVHALVTLGTYCLLPRLARRLITRIVGEAYTDVVTRSKQATRNILEGGQETVLAGPRGAIVGHLVAPYLEQLGRKLLEAIGEKSTHRVVHPSVEACLKPLLKRRLAMALIAGQVAAGLAAAGCPIKGAI